MEESGLTFRHVLGSLHCAVILINGIKNLLDEYFSGVRQTGASVPGIKESHSYGGFNLVNRPAYPRLSGVQT